MPTSKKFRDNIHAKGTDIAVLSSGDSEDYISLTDIARYKSDAPDDVIKNWMRNRDTIEFLGLWEQLNNPEFKPVEFDGFKFRIIELLPQSKKFNRVTVAHPVFNYIIWSIALIACNIRQGNVVLTVTAGKHCDVGAFGMNVISEFLRCRHLLHLIS